MAVKDYVEGMAKGDKPVNKIYQHILLHGEYFVGAVDHTAIRRSALVRLLAKAKMSWCFYNAQMLSTLHPLLGVKYYEGAADNGIFVGAHAWNLYERKVVDITWEKLHLEFPDIKDLLPMSKFEYFGINIPNEFVRENSPIRMGSVEPLAFKYLKLIG